VIMGPGQTAAPWVYGYSFESIPGAQAILVLGTRAFLIVPVEQSSVAGRLECSSTAHSAQLVRKRYRMRVRNCNRFTVPPASQSFLIGPERSGCGNSGSVYLEVWAIVFVARIQKTHYPDYAENKSFRSAALTLFIRRRCAELQNQYDVNHLLSWRNKP
jgi:hypothetical protein